MKNLFLLTFLLLNASLFAQNKVTVQPNNPNIHIKGSNYIKMKDGEMIIHRHADKVYQGTTKTNLFNPIKARTGTGILLEFKTKSPRIIAKFKIVKGLKKNPIFSVFQNGEFQKNESFKYEENAEIKIELIPIKKGESIIYTIAFPLKTDIHFLGLELEKGYDVLNFKDKNKGVYVAFGDSITHGTGQQITPETYAFQLANALDYELFNLAVGGGKTSQVMAEMIRDDFGKIDLITVLIGFNDYNGEGVTAEEFAKRYTKVLQTIRETHLNTKIYCITLLTTKANQSKTSGIAAEDFRKVVRNSVSDRQKKGDKNIFLIKGEDLTIVDDLKDQVHLNVEGAAKFAKSLYQEIKKHQ